MSCHVMLYGLMQSYVMLCNIMHVMSCNVMSCNVCMLVCMCVHLCYIYFNTCVCLYVYTCMHTFKACFNIYASTRIYGLTGTRFLVNTALWKVDPVIKAMEDLIKKLTDNPKIDDRTAAVVLSFRDVNFYRISLMPCLRLARRFFGVCFVVLASSMSF